MGRGGAIFSISSAMALASYAPTQMGSMVSLFTSFRIIIGVPLFGSIINARILTSISIKNLPLAHSDARSRRGQCFAIEAVLFDVSDSNLCHFAEFDRLPW